MPIIFIKHKKCKLKSLHLSIISVMADVRKKCRQKRIKKVAWTQLVCQQSVLERCRIEQTRVKESISHCPYILAQ